MRTGQAAQRRDAGSRGRSENWPDSGSDCKAAETTDPRARGGGWGGRERAESRDLQSLRGTGINRG